MSYTRSPGAEGAGTGLLLGGAGRNLALSLSLPCVLLSVPIPAASDITFQFKARSRERGCRARLDFPEPPGDPADNSLVVRVPWPPAAAREPGKGVLFHLGRGNSCSSPKMRRKKRAKTAEQVVKGTRAASCCRGEYRSPETGRTS